MYAKAEEINIMPIQTLLLFNPKITLMELPDDSTHLLNECVKILNPLRSLSQLCVENGIAYSEMLKVAKHLIFWNQCKIIYPISLKQIYILSRNSEYMNPDLASQFTSKFKQFKNTFEKALSMFSFPLRLEEHYETVNMTLKDFVSINRSSLQLLNIQINMVIFLL